MKFSDLIESTTHRLKHLVSEYSIGSIPERYAGRTEMILIRMQAQIEKLQAQLLAIKPDADLTINKWPHCSTEFDGGEKELHPLHDPNPTGIMYFATSTSPETPPRSEFTRMTTLPRIDDPDVQTVLSILRQEQLGDDPESQWVEIAARKIAHAFKDQLQHAEQCLAHALSLKEKLGQNPGDSL